MANEVELERIIVRLIGDGSSFQKMMTEAVATTRTMTNRMYTALSRVERFAGTLVRGLGSFGLASSLRGMFGQFADLEQGQIRLNAAIRGGGHDAEVLVARYTQVAESIAAVTLNSKGSVLSLFQQAEAQQLSGKAAEDAVRYAVALAGATGQSAEAMMRTAVQLQRGHPEFARRVLNLREVKDGTELVNKIMEKMNTGMAISAAEFNSANGRMERLGRALKGVGNDIGGMIAKVLLPVVGVLQQAFDAFKKLDPEIKQQTALVLGLTIAWLGMGPITQVLKDLLAPTIHLIKFLAIEIPLMAAKVLLWTAWKVVLLVVGATLTTFAGTALLVTGVLGLLKISVSSLTVFMTLMAAATWLSNAALAVWATLTSPAIILGSVAAVAVFATALYTVYAAVSSVVQAFRQVSGFLGPFREITKVFGEWWTMLKEVFLVAQNDLPRAWQMMKAGFDVAISQMKDAFTPLWDYIKNGFSAIWTAVSRLFIEKMTDAMYSAPRALRRFVLGEAGAQLLEGGRAEREREERERNILGTLNIALSNLHRNFQVVESNATRAARSAYESLRSVGGAASNVLPPLPKIESHMKKMADHAQRFDAALHGSVEAIARMAEYQDRLVFNPAQSPSLSPGQATAAAVGSAVGMGGGMMGLGQAVTLLADIRNILQNKNVIQLQNAGLAN